MPTEATSGSGISLSIGDGGIGDGTQAAKTIGTSNQQLRVRAKVAGTAGNTKTFGIVVAGNSTPFSIVVTANSVLINSATDAGGVATTTVLQAIAALYLNATFVENFQADVNTGTGAGVLVAGAPGVLSGGTNGAELFTAIAEVKSIGGPDMSSTVLDATHFLSADNTREFIASWIDPGTLSLTCNFLPQSTNQQSLLTAMKNRVRKYFRLTWSDAASTVCNMSGVVVGFSINNQLDAILEATVSVKLTGFPTWY